jgi:apolipoprotein D and lipocalin family protein
MKKMTLTFIFTLFSLTTWAQSVQVVNYVDLDQYVGRWYEIARYENSFQKKCAQTRVMYAKKGSKVTVHNQCVNKKNGKIKNAYALANLTDTKTNAKLNVSFVPLLKRWGFFGGAYWIIGLDVDYKWVVVGHPNREFLWFLSRTPTLDESTMTEMKMIAESQGYDLSKLKMSPTWVE